MFWKSFYQDDIQPEIQVAPWGYTRVKRFISQITLNWFDVAQSLEHFDSSFVLGGPIAGAKNLDFF